MLTDNSEKLIKDGFLGQRMVYVPEEIKLKVLENPKIRDLFITHIGHFPKAERHYRGRPLGCQQYIFIYCKNGEGWIELDNTHNIIKENTVFIIPPNIKCAYGASQNNPWNNYWIHFTGDLATKYAPLTGKSIAVPPGINARIDDRMILFEEMLSNMEQLSNFDNVIYANICLKYFLTSIRQMQNYRFSGRINSRSSLSVAISFMNNNLKTRITLDDLSAACQCSKSNLNKIFTKNLHCAPMDYYIQLKMQQACRYLAHSNQKIKLIAQELGYEDQYYFSRLFSKTIGKSPSEYRKEERGI